jgi:DNA-binding response OmpR family regulator
MRVLLADADEVHLEIVQSFLWDRGHEAEIATDALECLSILREFLPDVLVLDRDLLWGGSEGVLAAMHNDPLLPEISVVLTTDGELEEPLIGLARLPLACLAKPYRLGDLLWRINTAQARPSISASTASSK